jgi:hypothetical protein
MGTGRTRIVNAGPPGGAWARNFGSMPGSAGMTVMPQTTVGRAALRRAWRSGGTTKRGAGERGWPNGGTRSCDGGCASSRANGTRNG